jgi:hypothetical protein
MTTLTDWLDQAQARVDAATDGPWELDQFGPDEVEDGPFHFIGSPSDRHVVTPTVHMVSADAAFIAAARTDLPAAIAALQAVLAIHAASTEHLRGSAAYCVGCYEAGGEDGQILWPCPTVRAISVSVGEAP